jgi:uncharacterized protein (TIGR00661 family)
MKILYAIQATGNGHLSRAAQIIPYLKYYGQVDTFLSGSNLTLSPGFDVTYRSSGLSLFYSQCGGISFSKCFLKNSIIRAYKDANQLPVEKYDLVINDFDFITSRACNIKNIKSIHFGHQASFQSDRTPRPAYKSQWGEYVLKHFCKSDKAVGLHFQNYDSFIFDPIIKQSVLNSIPQDLGHITIYLPSINASKLEPQLLSLKDYSFHFFTSAVKWTTVKGNITYIPIKDDLFVNSLVNCHGLITGGGFETPSEAIYLQKKLLCIPISNQYEQLCNATALQKMGIPVVFDFKIQDFTSLFQQWIKTPKYTTNIKPNNIEKTIEHLVYMNQNA